MPIFLDPKGTPEERIQAFIAQGRAMAMRRGLDFDALSWEVSRLLAPRIARADNFGRLFLHFTKKGRNPAPNRALPCWISDFAKAYIVHFLGRTQITGLTDRLDAFKYIFAAVDDSSLIVYTETQGTIADAALKPPSLANSTIANFDAAVEGLKEHYCPGAARNRAIQLELIATFLDEKGMVRSDLANWQHGCEGVQPLDSTSGIEFEENAMKRLPAPGVKEVLAKAFARAVLPADVLTTASCALMQCIPSRASQVLSIEENCATFEILDGVERLVVRFPGAKRSAPRAGVVPLGMMYVVGMAFDRMHAITAEPRAIKRWYDTHPETLYLPPRLEHLRRKSLLTVDEASELIGIAPSYFKKYAKKKCLNLIGSQHAHPVITFARVERLILERLSRMESACSGKSYHRLMLLHWGALTSTTGGSPCMYQPFRYETFCSSLTPRTGRMGMFQRLGADPAGLVQVHSHAFRHDLTTEAARAGLSHEDLSEWFGRQDPRWTSFYDHSTNADFRDALSGIDDVFFGRSGKLGQNEKSE